MCLRNVYSAIFKGKLSQNAILVLSADTVLLVGALFVVILGALVGTRFISRDSPLQQ